VDNLSHIAFRYGVWGRRP